MLYINECLTSDTPVKLVNANNKRSLFEKKDESLTDEDFSDFNDFIDEAEEDDKEFYDSLSSD